MPGKRLDLHQAINQGKVTFSEAIIKPPDVGLAEELCRDSYMDVNVLDDEDRYSPLMLCALYADWQIREQKGSAVDNGYLKIMQMILRHPRCDVNLTSGGDTALAEVCNFGASVDVVRILLEHPDVDVNSSDGVGATALSYCAFQAKDDHGLVMTNNHVKAMEMILKHPKCNSINTLKCGRSILSQICSHIKSVRAARLILQQENVDITIQDKSGKTALHILMENAHGETSSVVARIMAPPERARAMLEDYKVELSILREFVKHPKIHDCMGKLDNAGHSMLDIFLLRERFHAYNINISKYGQEILAMILSVKGASTASGKSLAYAAMFASPQAFEMILEKGGDVNDTLDYGESTAHCVAQRNSVRKAHALLAQQQIYPTIWNHCTSFQLAQANDCQPELLDAFSKIFRQEQHQQIKKREASVVNYLSCSSKKGPIHGNWKEFKRLSSSKISINKPHFDNDQNRKDAVRTVKYCRWFVTANPKDVQAISHAIDTFFTGISTELANSPHTCHMAFTHFLRGSTADGTKCFGPTEQDIVCVFSNAYIHIKIKDPHHRGFRGWWAVVTNKDLDVRYNTQAFYREFARLCNKYNKTKCESAKGIHNITFQFMHKISRLKVVLAGGIFNDFVIHVDVVPSYLAYFKENTQRTPSYKLKIPLGITCNKFHVVAKVSRFDSKPIFPLTISYNKAEQQIMTTLPEPTKQGFIIAKAVRLASICAPGLDLQALHVAEDLSVDDYVTSHMLKTCLLIILQNIQHPSEIPAHIVDTFKSSLCKYVIAGVLYQALQLLLDAQRLRVWYEQGIFLFECPDCESGESMCCRKRQIQLALIGKIRAWLTDSDNIYHLHDQSAQCNCSYSAKELHRHKAYFAHLESTGSILLPSNAMTNLLDSV